MADVDQSSQAQFNEAYKRVLALANARPEVTGDWVGILIEKRGEAEFQGKLADLHDALRGNDEAFARGLLRLGFPTAPGTSHPVPRDMDFFRSKLVDGGDPKVLQYVRRYFSREVQIAASTEDVRSTYNDASHLPRTATRARLSEHENLVVNGLFSPAYPSRSKLFHLFTADSLQPMIMKIPRTPAETRFEYNICCQLASGDVMPPHLAGPMRLLQIKEEGDLALVMPLYSASLGQLPPTVPHDTVLRVGKQILSALQSMHAKGLCHNDVKALNIFLDIKGTAFLGDFGSARAPGKDADERTLSHLPEKLIGFDVDRSTFACDKLQLAITLLVQVAALDVTEGCKTEFGVIHKAILDLRGSPLSTFIQSLVPAVEEEKRNGVKTGRWIVI